MTTQHNINQTVMTSRMTSCYDRHGCPKILNGPSPIWHCTILTKSTYNLMHPKTQCCYSRYALAVMLGFYRRQTWNCYSINLHVNFFTIFAQFLPLAIAAFVAHTPASPLLRHWCSGQIVQIVLNASLLTEIRFQEHYIFHLLQIENSTVAL